ncbi:odorant receptor 49a-like [Prorops nasuta]|uniref:odorant receptor 49a-like n=1 Tax=Prorops nasuta TaxID=863751 RepID=UPI0034CD15A7
MDFNFEQSSFYTINRAALSLTGFWPFQNIRTYLIRRTILQIIWIYSICVQIAQLVEDKFNLNKIMEALPFISTLIVLVLFSGSFNRKTHAELWKLLKEDWMQERNEEENELKSLYAKWSHGFTKLVIYLTGFGAVIFMIFATFYSQILDFLKPLNESRPRIFPFEGKHFFNRDEHFYLVMGHIALVLITGFAFGVAQMTVFSMHLIHVSGMFSILGYRLDQAIEYKNYSKSSGELLEITRTFYLCVQRHQIALRYAALINNYYGFAFLVLLITTVLLITPNLYRLNNYSTANYRDIAIFIILLFFIFISTLLGQKLIDISGQINEKVYLIPWYSYPQHLQKLIPFVLNRTLNPCTISAYSFSDLSFDTFRMTLQTAFSYFMMLKQML